MYKIALCTFAIIVAVSMAAPQPQETPIQILKHDSQVSPDGYHFEFETSDGTSRQEQGTLKQISEDHKAIEVAGSYRYVAPNGLIYSVTYTADQDGFKPQERVEQA